MKESRSVFLPVLIVVIFFLSGSSSLIYQVAWQRLLTVYYGVGFYTVTLIVSIYMFGLGLGGYVGGILSEKVKNKIRFYLFVEILIGLFGVISPFFLDFLGKYTVGINYKLASLIIFSFLAIPTVLMGTTLPLLVKIYNGIKQDFFKSLSLLYFINTLGAATGALLSGYVLITFWGLDKAIYTAAVINVFIGLLLYFFTQNQKKDSSYREPLTTVDEQASLPASRVYFIVFVTGFIAIGYELVWFRMVALFAKDSPYAFSSVLFVYLLGLAIGSYAVYGFIKKRDIKDIHSLFFLLQFLLGCYVVIVFYSLYWLTGHSSTVGNIVYGSFNEMIHPKLSRPHSLTDVFLALDIFIWPILFFIFPTIIMGASFPLISSIAQQSTNREGKVVGTIYFFNILGNVLGGIITGFVLLPVIKTSYTLLLFSSLNIMFFCFVRSTMRGNSLKIIYRIMIPIVVTIINYFVFPSNEKFYTVFHSKWDEHKSYQTFLEEGKESIIVTYQNGKDMVNYINGSSHGFRPGYTYYYETTEALGYARRTDSILVIGLGLGSIVDAVLRNPDTKKVTLVELNESLIVNLKKIKELNNILTNPKLSIVIEDGRRFLYQSKDKYDVVFIDALRNQTAYSNNIHSVDFYNLIKTHLTAGGILMVGGAEDPVNQKTLLTSYTFARFYKYFMLGSTSKLDFNQENYSKLFANFDSIEQQNIALQKESYIGNEIEFSEKLKNTPYNTDWNPIAEYYLGEKHKIAKCN